MIRLARGTEAPRRRTPVESLVLATTATAPIAAAAAYAVVAGPATQRTVTGLAIGWSRAILCFLSGVRRGHLLVLLARN